MPVLRCPLKGLKHFNLETKASYFSLKPDILFNETIQFLFSCDVIAVAFMYINEI